MFRYKSAKYKSNYVRVTIPFYIDGFSKNEYTLVLPLFGEEHTVSARFEMGNGYVGETVLNYAYDNGIVKVCAYNWEDKGYYEPPPHYTRPMFNLYKKSDENDTLVTANTPVLSVSSADDANLLCSVNDSVPMNAIEPIKANLRTVYDYVREALEGTGVSLRIHVDDIVEVDKNLIGGAIVVGAAIQNIAAGSYFYNICGTSEDPRPAPQAGQINNSWVGHHAHYTLGAGIPLVYRCASVGHGRPCSAAPLDARTCVGGHVYDFRVGAGWGARAIPLVRKARHYWNVTGLNRQQHALPRTPRPMLGFVPGSHVYLQNTVYFILPICKRHNSDWHFDAVMMIPNPPPPPPPGDRLLCLNGFRSDFTH